MICWFYYVCETFYTKTTHHQRFDSYLFDANNNASRKYHLLTYPDAITHTTDNFISLITPV